jgi:glutathione S-transferase|tara:strand:+ start:796 stop:981 length:186 start_codon:yes stop_codon:yes gene_type:complete
MGIKRVTATIETICPNDGLALGGEFSTADVVFGGFLDFSMVFNWYKASPKVARWRWLSRLE